MIAKKVKLGEVCEIVAGQSPPGSTYSTEEVGLPFFQGKADFGLLHPVPRIWCKEPLRIAQPGDILISIRAPVGPTNVANVECCIGRGLAALRPKQGLDRDFILFWLRSQESTIAHKGSGSTFGAIGVDHLANLEIPLPTKEKQSEIAQSLKSKLRAVEVAQAAAKERLKTAKVLAAAYVREVFESTEAITWPRVPLGEICFGRAQYGLSEKSNGDSHEIPILGMVNISGGEIVWNNLRYIALSNEDKKKYLLHRGDVLFNRTNSAELVGKAAVFADDRDAVFASYLVRFKIKPELADPYFVTFFINSSGGRSFIESRMARAIGQVNINPGTMLKMPVRLPSLDRQRELSARLRERTANARKLLQTISEEFNSIINLPNALLREVFGTE